MTGSEVRSDDARALRAELQAQLTATVNPDGGWGYCDRKRSRVEPTAWALLAFGGDSIHPESRALAERAARWLVDHQRDSGFVAEDAFPPNLAFNGLALFALLAPATLADGAGRTCCRHLAAAIRAVRGRRLRDRASDRQDNQLRGWPWIDGTFSWVEPTSWCLLALNAYVLDGPKAASDPQLEEARAMLSNRACAGGGWNYGNASVLGRALPPYVPTTAVGLLALRHDVGQPAVKEALRWLAGAWRGERSGAATALTAIAFAAYGLPTLEAITVLAEAHAISGFLGNLAVAAMALCALSWASRPATSPFSRSGVVPAAA